MCSRNVEEMPIQERICRGGERRDEKGWFGLDQLSSLGNRGRGEVQKERKGGGMKAEVTNRLA